MRAGNFKQTPQQHIDEEMMKRKPIASLSFDLDDQWSYMRIHGDPGWESFPSYLDTVVPRVLKFLSDRNLRITFFVVGQDAALQRNRAAIRSIAAAGHEIGNHSFSHLPWIDLFAEQQIEDDLGRAEEHIESVTGHRPVGFRGAGYSLSRAALKVLKRRGYLYDASTLPTFIGPAARAYYFMTSHLTAEQRHERKQLFGEFRDGFRPVKPYRLSTGDEDPEDGILEIPVTTMPLSRMPIHTSYVLYLSKFSQGLALTYMRTALLLCRLTGTQPSHLLHPLDFLGCDDTRDLPFFPAMDLSSARKMAVVEKIVGLLAEHFHLVTLHEHAKAVAQQANVRVVQASFGSRQIRGVSESSNRL